MHGTFKYLSCLFTQVNVVRVNNDNDQVKEDMGKVQWEMSQFKRERTELELSAIRTQKEKQKVRVLSKPVASWDWQVIEVFAGN